MFWLVNNHAIRKLMDVPPLLQTLGQKHATSEAPPQAKSCSELESSTTTLVD